MIKIVQLFVLLFVPKTLNALSENNNNSQHVTPYGPIHPVLSQSFLTAEKLLFRGFCKEFRLGTVCSNYFVIITWKLLWREKEKAERKKKQNEVYPTSIFGFKEVYRTEQAVMFPSDNTCISVSLSEIGEIFAIGFATRGVKLRNDGYSDRNYKEKPKLIEKDDGHLLQYSKT